MFFSNLRQTLSGRNGLASRTILWLVGFFAFLNVYSMQAVLPLVMLEFHASPVQAGATVGATVLAIALVSPFIGMLSDVLGRKPIICTSLLGLTVPTALIPAVNDLHLLIVLRFFQGLFIPGIVVVLLAYIAEEFRFDRVARMTSVYVGGSVMGGFCGRFITGHAGQWLGWRGAFVTLALLNLFGALLTAWLLPPSRHFIPNRHVGKALETLAQHLHNKRLLAACGVGFCVLFCLVGTFTYVNLHLASAPFNLSTADLANVFCVYLVGVVITPLAGRFIVRLGFQRSLLYALGLSTIGLAMTRLPTLAGVILGLTVCSSGVFICQSATVSFIADSVREGRSLAMGLYYLWYYIGGAAGAWGAGVAYEIWSWNGSVLSIAVIQIFAAGITWFGWRRPTTGPTRS